METDELRRDVPGRTDGADASGGGTGSASTTGANGVGADAMSEKISGDATALVGAPGRAPAGKIHEKSGELVSEEEYADRKELEDSVFGIDRQIEAMRAAAADIELESPEKRKQRERCERSKRMIGATADGLSALANLYFTTQYAPNSYNPQSTQLGKVNDRIAALKAERKADEDRYNNLMIRIGDGQNARAKTLREVRAQQEARKQARKKANQEAEEHQWKALLQRDLQREAKGKGDKAVADAHTAAINAEYAPKLKEADLRTKGSQASAYQASAVASYARAAESNRKGFYGTFDGRTYTEKADYEKAVREAALEYNERNPKSVKKKRQVKGDDGNYREEEYDAPVDAVPLTWTKKTAYGDEPQYYDAPTLAATLEPLLRKEREQNTTPPSRREGKKKDKTPPSRRGGNNDNVPPSKRK